VDTEVTRAAASSSTVAASLALLTPDRFAAGGATAFAARTGAAWAAAVVDDFFPAAGATLTADVFLADAVSLASVTFPLRSFAREPVA